MKIIVEESIRETDRTVLNAAIQYASLYPTDTIDDLWESLKKCNFDNHDVGKAGSHIWIHRVKDNKRIAMIID